MRRFHCLPHARRILPPVRHPRRALACALLLAAGGCAGPQSGYNRGIARLQLMQATELPANQVDRLSGTYKGLATLTTAPDPRCPVARTGTLELGDNRLELAYTAGLIFSVPVQPDGAVQGTIGPATLRGRIANGYASFTVSTPGCTTQFDYRYVT